MYKMYYIDEAGNHQSTGDNAMASSNEEEAIEEFKGVADDLSEMEGWEATQFVLIDDDGKVVSSRQT